MVHAACLRCCFVRWRGGSAHIEYREHRGVPSSPCVLYNVFCVCAIALLLLQCFTAAMVVLCCRRCCCFFSSDDCSGACFGCTNSYEALYKYCTYTYKIHTHNTQHAFHHTSYTGCRAQPSNCSGGHGRFWFTRCEKYTHTHKCVCLEAGTPECVPVVPVLE